MSGKILAHVTAMTQIYFLTSTKKTFLYDQQLTSSAQAAQFQKTVLQLEFLKKSGVCGEEFSWKMERFLESFLGTGPKNNGAKLGKA